jgi:hypothetical protein
VAGALKYYSGTDVAGALRYYSGTDVAEAFKILQWHLHRPVMTAGSTAVRDCWSQAPRGESIDWKMEVGEEKVKYINYSRLIQGHS